MAATGVVLPRQQRLSESCSGRNIEQTCQRVSQRSWQPHQQAATQQHQSRLALYAVSGSSAASHAAQPPAAISSVAEPELAPAATQWQREQAGDALAAAGDGLTVRTGKQIEEAALRSAIEWKERHPNGLQLPNTWPPGALEEAYKRCGDITKDYAKTFYLGTKLMTPEKANAIWAIYVWCRRTDELVDGPNASRITPTALDSWEERLEALFDGRPYDILDAALTATISKFAVPIQPFKDMIDGMRMDLRKSRYHNFDELYEYCYKVAGTVGLMTAPVMGVEPSYKGPLEAVYRAALSLGIANQLTNILRDVGEDANERDRLYVPLDDLEHFGITEDEALNGMFARHSGRIDDRWARFMKFQISRARAYFADAQAGVDALDRDARWPVWSALILYRQILDAIEKNNFDNFTQRAYVKKWKKYLSLPLAYARARFPDSASLQQLNSGQSPQHQQQQQQPPQQSAGT